MYEFIPDGQAARVLIPLGLALIAAAIMLVAWHRIRSRRARTALRTTLVRYKVWDWITGITGSRQRRLTYEPESKRGKD